MDTSYFAYDWKLSFFTKRERRDFNHNLPYIVVNLNKNGEKFLPNLINDLQIYLKQGYTIYFVPVAKGYNTYYNDLQYQNILEQQL
ncbi:MAG: hypothetical protein LBG59_04045 [Candidatus Peribacteria bacterium]|nr:hypothetical protein [Candidatus Peribacteria bacterium]